MSGAMSPLSAQASAARRNGHLVPGSTALTPFDAMVAAEETKFGEEERLIREEAISTWLGWIFEGGPDLQRAVKRLYSYARAFRPDLVRNMSGEELASLFNQTRAAESARTKKLVEATFAKAGYRVTKVPFQKSEAACAKYRVAAKGNKNRSGKTSADVGQARSRKAA